MNGIQFSNGHRRPALSRAAVLVTLFAIVGLLLMPSASRAEIPDGWPWKITHLVYPTLGQPVIIKKGETFTLEFDCVGRGEGTDQPAVWEWTATLSSSNDRWPTETACPIESATDGVSERWPGDSTVDYWKGSGPWAGKEVWKVTVRVPADTRTDLYDLLVTAGGAAGVSDSQPHAVQVLDEYKDEYTFIQITDFHINDPRGPASWIALPEPHPDSEEFRDYKYNSKAIDCVNLLNPDFVIMSGDTVFGIPFFVEYPWESTGITDFCGTAPDWIGEDLRNAGGNYDLLIMASHHPFYGDYGEGDSFDDPADYDGDGTCDPALFRPSSGLWAVRDVTRTLLLIPYPLFLL